MHEKWYFFIAGILIAAGFIALIESLSSGEGVFTNIPTTGFLVRDSVMRDITNANKVNVVLLDYNNPFDGTSNLPSKIIYRGQEYNPKTIGYETLKKYSNILKIKYLLSIGESANGKFPVYFVSLEEGQKPIIEGIVVLDQAFPEGQEPFT